MASTPSRFRYSGEPLGPRTVAGTQMAALGGDQHAGRVTREHRERAGNQRLVVADTMSGDAMVADEAGLHVLLRVSCWFHQHPATVLRAHCRPRPRFLPASRTHDRPLASM
jgi:hypothetical protein